MYEKIKKKWKTKKDRKKNKKYGRKVTDKHKSNLMRITFCTLKNVY